MKKLIPFLFIICFILISCKEKSADIKFSFEGNFSQKFLEKMIDDPESLQAGQEQTPFPMSDPNSMFMMDSGLSVEESNEIIKNIGACSMSFQTTITVDLNGFSVTKMYMKEGVEFNWSLSCENELPEVVFESVEVTREQVPGLVVNFGDDKKSFSYYCVLPEEIVMFDSKETGEEMNLSDMKSGGQQDGTKVKMKGNKIFITAEDKELGTSIKMVIEMPKG